MIPTLSRALPLGSIAVAIAAKSNGVCSVTVPDGTLRRLLFVRYQVLEVFVSLFTND